jgi:1-acyl-sn-glycerol-3-phosphate acyltransferase
VIPTASGVVPQRGNAFSRWFGRTILRLLGWRLSGELPQVKKILAIAAPHSSNMDAVIGFAAVLAMGLDVSWMGKDALFRGPFNRIARWGGGIPVNRSGSAKGQVQSAIAEFQRRDSFWCALAPEGTRKPVSRWKTGFYRIAEGAQVPLMLCHFDYRHKSVGLDAVFMPTGDMAADLAYLQRHYASFVGKGGKRVQVMAPEDVGAGRSKE